MHKLLLVFAILLSACGGGSSNGETQTNSQKNQFDNSNWDDFNWE